MRIKRYRTVRHTVGGTVWVCACGLQILVRRRARSGRFLLLGTLRGLRNTILIILIIFILPSRSSDVRVSGADRWILYSALVSADGPDERITCGGGGVISSYRVYTVSLTRRSSVGTVIIWCYNIYTGRCGTRPKSQLAG